MRSHRDAGRTIAGSWQPRHSSADGARSGLLGEYLLGGADGGAEVDGKAEIRQYLFERRQRDDDVELGGVSHVAETKDLPFHLALPARDRDVVRLRVGGDDRLAVHAA